MAAFEPRDPGYQAAVRASFARQGALAAIGAELIGLAPGECRIRLPLSERVTQQQGFFHGGVLGAVADSAGGYAAMTLVPPGAEVLTVEYKINFLAPAQGPEVVATGRVVRSGRTLVVARAEVELLQPRRPPVACAVLQQTIMVVAPR